MFGSLLSGASTLADSLGGGLGGSLGSGLTGGGGAEGPSSAESSASTSVNFNSGPFGGSKDWMDYLPVILMAIVVLFVIKKG